MANRTENSSTTYYQILGINSTATPAEIKAAYRRVLLSSHPDKNPPSCNHFSHSNEFDVARIQDAYRVLSDVDSRADYDASLSGDQLFSKDCSNTSGPRPAQVVSLEEFCLESDDATVFSWAYTCRCGGMYSVTEEDMVGDRHLIACSQCSEVVYVGYDVLEVDQDGVK